MSSRFLENIALLLDDSAHADELAGVMKGDGLRVSPGIELDSSGPDVIRNDLENTFDIIADFPGEPLRSFPAI